MKSTIRVLNPTSKIEKRLVPKESSHLQQSLSPAPHQNPNPPPSPHHPLSQHQRSPIKLLEQSPKIDPILQPQPMSPLIRKLNTEYSPQIRVTIRRSDSSRNIPYPSAAESSDDCRSERSVEVQRPSYTHLQDTYRGPEYVGIGYSSTSNKTSNINMTPTRQPINLTANVITNSSRYVNPGSMNITNNTITIGRNAVVTNSSINSNINTNINNTSSNTNRNISSSNASSNLSTTLSSNNNKTSLNCTNNGQCEDISSDYYTKIDCRLSTGIKKLQEIDQKLNAYDQKHNNDHNNSLNNTIGSIATGGATKDRTININAFTITNTSTLTTNPTPTLNINPNKTTITIDKNISLRQSQLALKKKQQYLQQILSKTKKIKQLESLLSEKQHQILSLTSQNNILTQKSTRLEEQLRNISNFQQDYQKNQQVLKMEIESLTIQNQERIMEANRKCNQVILSMKKNGEDRERTLGKEIQNVRREKEQFVQQLELQIQRIQKQNTETLSSLKQTHSKQLSLIYNQLTQKIKKLTTKQLELSTKQQQIQKKDIKIQQVHKLHEYYKGECKKMEGKLREELGRRCETQEMLAREVETKEVLLADLQAKNGVIEALRAEIEEKMVLLGKETQKIREIEQYYTVQISKLTQNFNTTIQKLSQTQTQLSTALTTSQQYHQKLSQQKQKTSLVTRQLAELEQKQNDLILAHQSELKKTKQQYESKSKQIFQKLTDYYQQKQRLNQEINSYKSKIQQKQKELNEQGYKMHEIENLIKNNEKEIFIKKAEYEKLNRQILRYEELLAEIQMLVGKEEEKCKGVQKVGQKVKTAEEGQEEPMNNIAKKIEDILIKINKENRALSLKLTTTELQIKTLKHTLHEKDSIQPQSPASLPTPSLKPPTTPQESQTDPQPPITTPIAATTIQTQTQATTSTSTSSSNLTLSTSASTSKLSHKNKLISQLAELENLKKEMQSSHMESQTSASRSRESQGGFQEVGVNTDDCFVKQEQKQGAQIQILPTTMPKKNPCQSQLHSLTPISTNPSSNPNLSSNPQQILLLKQQLEQKQQIIEVMQSCIEDYKDMVKDMKYRLENQQIIENQYMEILEFFDISATRPQEHGHGNREGDGDTLEYNPHEELLDIITTFTNKLQKMIQTVTCLESELHRSTSQNTALKQKKKKMIRELKRCQTMIEKACIENEQLEARLQEAMEKIQRGDFYVKELLGMIVEGNQEVCRARVVGLELRMRARNGKLGGEDEEIEEQQEEEEKAQEKVQIQKEETSNKKEDDNMATQPITEPLQSQQQQSMPHPQPQPQPQKPKSQAQQPQKNQQQHQQKQSQQIEAKNQEINNQNTNNAILEVEQNSEMEVEESVQ